MEYFYNFSPDVFLVLKIGHLNYLHLCFASDHQLYAIYISLHIPKLTLCVCVFRLVKFVVV
jgi:hypothetical protein